MAGAVQPGGASGRRRRRRRQMADINVTPMVDVMLVLLVVFMVTAPLLTTGVAVDLPKSDSSALPGQDEPLSVTIAGDGRIYLQESGIELDQLGPRLLAITERKPETRVFVRGDRSVDYGQVMAVVGAINRAGITKVALLTEAAPSAGQSPARAASAASR